ncbi:MAG: glycosyltransferase [Selenomonas sp.]
MSFNYGEVIEVQPEGESSEIRKRNAFIRREIVANFCVGKNPPLVTVCFQAYNHLEDQTKMAIHALLQYTQNVDYELILIDNGSTDGTLEFFRSIPYEKKRIFHVRENRGALAGYIAAKNSAGGEFIRGRYVSFVPGDVIVTKDWLKNLVTCMESDSRIGMVVPVANYTSNHQKITLPFSNYEEMQEVAAAHNISNPKKWEECLRVIPTTALLRSSLRKLYELDHAFYYNFSDDDLSFTYRRLGYRLMICRDTFVYHAEGSTMTGEDYQLDIQTGREIFRRKYFGIDPWDDTRLDAELRDKCLSFVPVRKEHRILGIDIRCGADLLHFKNGLRGVGFEPVKLSALVQDAKYWQDLQTVCDEKVFCRSQRDFAETLRGRTYDYIILGEPLCNYEEPQEMLEMMRDHLSMGGRMTGRIEKGGEVFVLERNA